MIKQIFDYLITNNFGFLQIPNYGLAPDIFGLNLYGTYVREEKMVRFHNFVCEINCTIFSKAKQLLILVYLQFYCLVCMV